MKDMKVDWGEIRSRLEGINAAIEKGFSPSPEEKKRILKFRASLLAKQAARTTEGECIEVVEFLLAQEHYGLEARYIREVYPLRDYTPVPCTPQFVLGLINVRGQIVPVIDIKKFFDMAAKGISDLNKVIIIHNSGIEFGVLADAVLGVRSIALSEIQPPLPTLAGMREEFLRGVTGDRTVVLDAGKLLNDRNIVVHEEVI